MGRDRNSAVQGGASRLAATIGGEPLHPGTTVSQQSVRLVPPELQIEETFVLERPGRPASRRSWGGMANGFMLVTMLLFAMVWAKGEWSTSASWERRTDSGSDPLASPAAPPVDGLLVRRSAPPTVEATHAAEGQRPLSVPPQPVQPQPQPVQPLQPLQEQRPFDRETIAVMVKRGRDLIDSGDLAAARIVLERAAEAGNADAAWALATTYDPAILRKLKVYGLAPDAAKARIWYQQARKFGSRAAPN